MFKYFRELDNPSEQYLNFIDNRHVKKIIDIEQIPFNKYLECLQLIKELNKYNPLKIKSNEKNMIFTNYSNINGANSILDEELLYDNEMLYEGLYTYGYDDVYSSIIYGIGLDQCGFTKNGSNKLLELIYDYLIKFDDDAMCKYIDVITNNFNEANIISNKYNIMDILYDKKELLKYQNRLPISLENKVNDMISYLKNYSFKITDKDYYLYDMKLNNSWFITPYNHLYNTLGYYEAHQVANIKDLYYELLQSSDIESIDYLYNCYRNYLDELNMYKDKGYFTLIDFRSTFNFKWDAFSLDGNYYTNFDAKCYDRKILNIFIGLDSAKAALYEFFYELKNNSNNYERDINTIRNMDFVDFLVRCCRFNKVESCVDKTITTSCINYEVEFKEYLNRGWKINFITPFILNGGILKEYPEDFLKIRKVLKNY